MKARAAQAGQPVLLEGALQTPEPEDLRHSGSFWGLKTLFRARIRPKRYPLSRSAAGRRTEY
jgi:hypothetical protein